MRSLEHQADTLAALDIADMPVLICLLGSFRLLQHGQEVAVYGGGKREALLSYLALQHRRRVLREQLLTLLWPSDEPKQAGRSLNNLIYSLHKLLKDALDGAPLVLYEDGFYRLNLDGGVHIDVALFDALMSAGDEHARAGDQLGASAHYDQAAALYRGDLGIAVDVQAILERERLRNRYLVLLSQLADYQYSVGDYAVCLEYAWRLLAYDPCREDAHRLVMRCFVRTGRRAAALHQYQVCTDILRAEFEAVPEVATTALFNQIRLRPDAI
jgi:DNA-binding SARP family transcriptional activator